MMLKIFRASSLRELLIREYEAEIQQKAFQESFQQGYEEGLRLGRLEMAHKILHDLAQQHFGSLQEETRQLIKAQSDFARLYQTILQVTTLSDEAALFALLQVE